MRWFLLLAFLACQGSVPLPPELGVSPRDVCRVGAVLKVIPEDYRQLSVGDLEDARDRLKACEGSAADAGAP